MARQGPFDVGKTVKLLNQTRHIELATVVYNTHYASMVYGQARIPAATSDIAANCCLAPRQLVGAHD